MLTLHDLRERGMSNPTRVIHSICGHIVFWHDGVPQKKASVINPEKVILYNGVKPGVGDPIYCQGCGYEVRKNQLLWVLNDD